jgi:REP element-mobilizing transposase RayT
MKNNPNSLGRQSIRLRGYDYANAGAYFVTICCRVRANMNAGVENFQPLQPQPQPLQLSFGNVVGGKMVLNKCGEIATQCWREIPQHFPHTVLHEYVIMPDHLHGIIEITNPAVQSRQNAFQKIIPRSIGSIIRGFKIGVTKQLGYSIWQRNYHEHIIRNETEYAKIAKYIRNNPILWGKKRLI